MTIQETGVKLYDACCDGKYWDIQPLLRQHPSLLNRGLDEVCGRKEKEEEGRGERGEGRGKRKRKKEKERERERKRG